MRYTVSMRATPDTYEYTVYKMDGDEVVESRTYDLAEVFRMTSEVRNNYGALAWLSENASTLF